MRKDFVVMILFPIVGRMYWMVTDFHERFYPVPVRIECGGRCVSVKLPLSISLTSKPSRRELFHTRRAALKRARLLNHADEGVAQYG